MFSPTLLSCSTASCGLYNRTEHSGGFFICYVEQSTKLYHLVEHAQGYLICLNLFLIPERNENPGILGEGLHQHPLLCTMVAVLKLSLRNFKLLSYLDWNLGSFQNNDKDAICDHRVQSAHYRTVYSGPKTKKHYTNLRRPGDDT